MCVLFSVSLPCVGFCKKISVRSCRKSVLPEMQRFLRCGIRNSSSGFWVRSIAVLQKGSEITPSSYWHAAWDCVLGIFAHSNWITCVGRSPQKRGLHSLRHTLATRLLEKGTPLPTIAEILGHTSLESTRIYAKADVEALRGVALNLDEVNHAS